MENVKNFLYIDSKVASYTSFDTEIKNRLVRRQAPLLVDCKSLGQPKVKDSYKS